MPVEVANGVAANVLSPSGDLKSQNPNTAAKKSRESRRRRRKQKKGKQNAADGDESGTGAEDRNGAVDENSKENSDPQKELELVEVEYVPEKAELDGMMDEEFRKVFEKFNFMENSVTEENDKKDDVAADAAKKSDSDSDEGEQDIQQKEKGVSNKKKKLQRRMKIAELKQICSRPDVVEGKRGIEKQPFQLPDFIAATGIEKIRQVVSILMI